MVSSGVMDTDILLYTAALSFACVVMFYLMKLFPLAKDVAVKCLSALYNVLRMTIFLDLCYPDGEGFILLDIARYRGHYIATLRKQNTVQTLLLVIANLSSFVNSLLAVLM